MNGEAAEAEPVRIAAATTTMPAVSLVDMCPPFMALKRYYEVRRRAVCPNYPRLDERSGRAYRRPALGAAWARGRRVLQGRVRCDRGVSRRRHGRPSGGRVAALGRRRHLLGRRRIPGARE